MVSFHRHLQSLVDHSKQWPRQFADLKGVDFCSNDYLSLRSHPQIRSALLQCIRSMDGLCSTGSRLVSGHNQQIDDLEIALADFTKRPGALFFANGYQANIAVLTALLNNCEVFSDQENHASLIDGLRLSRCQKNIFRHNDLNHLEHLLLGSGDKAKAIVTESVFSTNGDLCDLSGLLELAYKFQTLLIVDESHAAGVFGANKAGRLSDFSSLADNVIATYSCGKAFASFGGFISCSNAIKSVVKNLSRQFICSTAVPLYVVHHVMAALRVIACESHHHQNLWRNIEHCGGLLKTSSPIISVPIGNDELAMTIKRALAQSNLDVAAFRYPSVAKGHAKLRITIHAHNSLSEIDRLQSEIDRFYE